MENNQIPQLSEDKIERLKLAYKLSKEVVEEMQLPDIKEMRTMLVNQKRTLVFKHDDGEDIEICARVLVPVLGSIEINFFLTFVAHDAIWLIEYMLSEKKFPELVKPTVYHQVKKMNLDILTLFDLSESDVPEVIEYHAKGIIRMFLENIHNFTESAILDAWGHSKIGYYQHAIKPLLKEHWENLGLPEDFDLITQNELDEVRKYDLGRKRWFLGDKKQGLDMNLLTDQADYLRKKYKAAKKEFNKYKNSFYLLNKNATNDDWQEKWLELRSQEFPILHPKALDVIEQYAPFELAAIHLSYVFGYGEETIKKKITEAKKQKREKN